MRTVRASIHACSVKLFIATAVYVCAVLGAAADTVVQSQAFSYANGAVQAYVAPAGTDYVEVRAWGAGGGSSYSGSGWTLATSPGGNGAFVSAYYPARSGDRIELQIGGGGGGCTTPLAGRGGQPGGGNARGSCGGGGGYTRISLPSGTVIAAGGGGAGGGSYSAGGSGGTPVGGGAGGTSGGGGTQTAGGAAGVENAYTKGEPGTFMQGGNASPTGGAGGGGGGYYGGGSGAGYSSGAGGGGSSIATGAVYSVRYSSGPSGGPGYPGGVVSLGGSSGGNGGDGAAMIVAYKLSPKTTIVGGAQANYIVPIGTAYIVVKAWGGGGSGNRGSTVSSGGAGAFASGAFTVFPGQVLRVLSGQSAALGEEDGDGGTGGPVAGVVFPEGARIIAGGGGGGGTAPGGSGGAGGVLQGSPGGSGYGSSGGSGGATSGTGFATSGTGGAGGQGDAWGYDSGDNYVLVGNGHAGSGYLPNQIWDQGWGGSRGDIGDGAFWGGSGGDGIGGGGGAGSGSSAKGGGGGGGGSSAVIGSAGTPVASSLLAGSGSTPPSIGDADYPGSNVGYGGAPNSLGGPSAVVLIAYPAIPTITSTGAQFRQPGQAVDFWIATQSPATSFGASNLPPGLSLDSATGHVTGTPTTPGTYTSTLSATNATGTAQATVVWNIDSTPPSVPAALAASAIASSQFVLSWSASVDSVGVTAYEIARDGLSLGTVATNSASILGLQPTTTYALTVRAGDAAGNWSAWSSPLSVTTTADLAAPSAPAGLVASHITATSLTLTWSAASDDVGVTGYEVRRNGSVSIGTTSMTSLTVTGLSPVTSYTFGVRARDAAGNWSAWSDVTPGSPLSVTTTIAGRDTLLDAAVFTANDRNLQPYTVPSGANYIVVKAWGAGGGARATTHTGGNAAYVTATYNVRGGESLSVSVGTGGWGASQTLNAGGWVGGGDGSIGGGGGGASRVSTPYGTVWSAGGGGSGGRNYSVGHGGSGGAATGGAGSSPSGGGGGTLSAGGAGNSGSSGSSGQGGVAAATNVAYNGAGGGGGGYYGGGAGSSGGGGGSSLANGSPYNVTYRAGASVPGAIDDPYYPGNFVGYGGLIGSNGQSGGAGYVVVLAYQTPGTYPTQTFLPTGASQTFTVPAGTDSVTVKAWGAGAANNGGTPGLGGDFVTATYAVSGGQTIAVNAGAGGSSAGAPGGATVVNMPGGSVITTAGGGSGTSSITSGSPAASNTQIVGETGTTPAGTSDANYPGNGTGYGAANGTGGGGAVVIVAHIVPPTITSALNQAVVQHQLVNYTITATNGPTLYTATGLPVGLTLDPTTGAITGRIAVPGTYTTTLTAANRGGNAQATLTWTVSTDSSAPTVPAALQASNVTFNSLVLTWSASTDNSGNVSYEIQRDGVPTATSAANSATLTLLAPATTYSFTVRAGDKTGNWSGWSSPITVTTSTAVGDALLAEERFGYSVNSAQTFTVPLGASYVRIKAWGAGGGGSTYNGTAAGGNGGMATATFDVVGGESLTVSVGQGGAANTSGALGGWPSGGSGGSKGGGGGGASKVETPCGTLWAGGGGGGGMSNYAGGHASGGLPMAYVSTPMLESGEAGGSSSTLAGGGGGNQGGSAGTTTTDHGGGGAGGTSAVTGTAYNVAFKHGGNLSYPGSAAYPIMVDDLAYPGAPLGFGGYAYYSGSANSGSGGNGFVLVQAFTPVSRLPTRTYYPTAQAQTYTVPSGTAYVLIKAWGGGGGGGPLSSGGGGAFASAICTVSAGQFITIAAGAGGRRVDQYATTGGGRASIVTLPGGSRIYAGGGGGAGTAPNSSGGGGGATAAQAGGGGYGSAGGGGGSTVGATGVGGLGGNGNAQAEETTYDENGNPDGTTLVPVGRGQDGGVQVEIGGLAGSAGVSTDYSGGQGGGGFGAGGGGGTGDQAGGGGGGGGGSSGVVIGSPAPTSVTTLAAVGSTAANTTDANYPGNNVGFGGLNGGDGGDGAVVIIAYPVTPAVTSPSSVSYVQYQPITYTIQASGAPTSYAASGLPAGLALNPATGVITGEVAAPGLYTSTVSATNVSGTGQLTLTWTITADTAPPSVPSGLVASDIGSTAFTLGWNASTDNGAVSKYEVKRDTVSVGTIAAVSVTVSSLSPSTTYAMSVRAADKAGNWSTWSAPLNVTTAASGQSAALPALNYADRTPTTVTLMWNGSAGAATYNIYRNGVLIGNTAEQSYVDTGLSAATNYAYVVRAVSGTGVESASGLSLTVATTADYSADTDGDGVPNTTETRFGTNPSVAGTRDTNNQLQFQFNIPSR